MSGGTSSSLSSDASVPTTYLGSAVNIPLVGLASDASWQAVATVGLVKFESIDQNAVDDGGGDDRQEEDNQFNVTDEDQSLSGEYIRRIRVWRHRPGDATLVLSIQSKAMW